MIKYLAAMLFGGGIALLLYFYGISSLRNQVIFVRVKLKKFLSRLLSYRRHRLYEKQIVDIINMISNCLKSGMSLLQSFEMVSKDAAHPLRDEFVLLVKQIKMGKSIENALIELRERVCLSDMNIVIESIIILRETGGNLVETFSVIVKTIVERQKVNNKIKVYVAQGVGQAIVLVALPFILIIFMNYMSGWYLAYLMDYPLGWFLLLAAFGLQVVGGIWLRKIVKIEV